jgi:membrane protease YdiL (CAAX protease family)
VKSPALLGTILLAHLLVVLPLLVWRSTRQFRAARAADPGPEAVLPVPRAQVFVGTIFMLGILFLLAWLAGRDPSYDIFRIGSIGAREILAGVAVFLLYLVLRKVARALHTDEERRRMVVRAMVPRSPLEWGLYVVMAIAAGIAEEAAYRGVGMYLLSQALGNAWVAALILSTAFALAHLLQEWKSLPFIFLMALAMHALVAVTGTLVVAMVVHAVFDLVAGVLAAREESP